ncbi:putative protein OS=Afipia felis OX=1035 GN=NCTC12722_03416 PE=4 SV=1 [Afipia felis]
MMRTKIVDRGFGYSVTPRIARDLTAAAVAAACLSVCLVVSLAILSIRFVSAIA